MPRKSLSILFAVIAVAYAPTVASARGGFGGVAFTVAGSTAGLVEAAGMAAVGAEPGLEKRLLDLG